MAKVLLTADTSALSAWGIELMVKGLYDLISIEFGEDCLKPEDILVIPNENPKRHAGNFDIDVGILVENRPERHLDLENLRECVATWLERVA